MKTFLYTITILVVIIWALGFFVYAIGSLLIHLLLILAVICGIIGYKIKSATD
ncbi:lmo0937 family membrane protein [Polaribacter pectinis]|uniref:Lmo0937 family membrane protein n=1 Tax=Polaribacter pectinis TaxID=2738844 RepID=A0A7G9L8L4_9FLAO|nr:lmo0937 family membrane protein [Polaribacter pectinis]QNM84963.1 lmo0937 family membrane protein [Polaribacter pectinis]